MNALHLACPQPPHFAVDWDALDRDHAFVRALRGCPQDAVWHGEGDVWIHTRMVCESLAESVEFRALPADQRAIAFAAALLHDVAKPLCTRTEDGRITSRGHSVRGENLARRILWALGAEPTAREEVARIIEIHQLPFFAIEKPNAARMLHRASQVTRLSLVALVAEADARGRIAQDQQRLLDNIELFRELAREQHCYDVPRAFASDHARVTYFRSEAGSADYEPFDDTWGEVTLLSGLPASGKDTWLRAHAAGLPVVSLDALRSELDVDPEDAQGAVISGAKERAREHLRRQQPFAWNATNLSRKQRAPLLSLFARYHARVRIVYVEAPHAEQRERNRARAQPVPELAIARMLERWQVPDCVEAHTFEWA
jgi:predicted kinase